MLERKRGDPGAGDGGADVATDWSCSMKTFAFLYATRFWALVIGAVSIYCERKGWIGEPEMILIATIMAGFVTVRTVDRATEQKILAEAVASGEIRADAVLEIPPPKTDALAAGATSKEG